MDSDEEKIDISLINFQEVKTELAKLPNDLRVDIEATIDSYGDLNLTSLLGQFTINTQLMRRRVSNSRKTSNSLDV